jgi:FAD/FMN-containing dehydrogenase
MTQATTVTSPSVISLTAIDSFAAALRGALIRPGDAGYHEARALFNGMIDKRPALIVRAADVADIIATVALARETGLALAIRGGGHNGAGLASVDDGIMLDLSSMKGIRVDPVARTVRVEPGATWADVDHATHAFGLATPNGVIGTTGVAGLTLGGGIGHLSRRFGLTIDNLLAADVVLADGSLVTANADEHPDLFWAIRGGGGNFGVVTSFLFRLHHVDTVIAGATLWPMEEAANVMRWYRTFLPNAPVELNGFFALLVVPPAPQFPEELHMQTMCGVVWCYTGPAEMADAVLAPVRSFGPPVYDGIGEIPFPALQGAFDGLYTPGMQWYWKADFVQDLPDEAIARHVEFGRQLPSMYSTMHLYPIDGAVHAKGRSDTAFSYRDVTWAQVIVGVDPEPANAAKVTAWARDYWEATHPYAAEGAGAYVNMMMEEGQGRIHASYRENYDTLAAIKTRYDPTNFFRVNQNIQPAAGEDA